MRKFTILIFALILASITAGHAGSTPATLRTKNVIVVVIDGVRYGESFGDPAHRYIPHIWNELRPQGTIYTNLWNNGLTNTAPGHLTLITGVWQPLRTNSKISSDQRAKEPTIFEYYRKEKSAPPAKTRVISIKHDNLRPLDYSLHPDYGYTYRAGKLEVMGTAREVYEQVKKTMDGDKPNLMLINFKDVDKKAHKGGYGEMTAATKTIDGLVYDLWGKIQSTPYYKDTTTLIITGDHGRHSDGFLEGFKDHGSSTREDRHLVFLALGPDIRRNCVIDSYVEQIDLAPTIGALLGFKTPYARGEIMRGMFVDQAAFLPKENTQAIEPKITAASTGLHMVYHVRTSLFHSFDVYYKNSKDKGVTWSKPQAVLTSSAGRRFYQADIASTDKSEVIVCGTALVPVEMGGLSYEWRLFSRISPDGGISWGPVEDRGVLGVFASNPVLISDGGDCIAVVPSIDSEHMASNLCCFKRAPDGVWSTAHKTDSEDVIILNPSVDICGGFIRGVWQSIGKKDPHKYWNISDFLFMSGHAGTERMITENTSASIFYYNPEISCSAADKTCHLAWSVMDGRMPEQARWKIEYAGGSNCGDAWSKAILISPPDVDAWNPGLCALENGQTLVVWEQHSANNVDVYGVRNSGEAWGLTMPLTPLDGIDSVAPDSASYGGVAYLAWQELRGSEWVVKARALE